MKDKTVFRLAIAGYIVAFICTCAFWAGVGYVAVHYIQKYW